MQLAVASHSRRTTIKFSWTWLSRFFPNSIAIDSIKSRRRPRRSGTKRWLRRKKRRNWIQGDDSAGIREARFAFPHYCHASNYAPSKATVRRVEETDGGGCRDERSRRS